MNSGTRKWERIKKCIVRYSNLQQKEKMKGRKEDKNHNTTREEVTRATYSFQARRGCCVRKEGGEGRGMAMT